MTEPMNRLPDLLSLTARHQHLENVHRSWEETFTTTATTANGAGLVTLIIAGGTLGARLPPEAIYLVQIGMAAFVTGLVQGGGAMALIRSRYVREVWVAADQLSLAEVRWGGGVPRSAAHMTEAGLRDCIKKTGRSISIRRWWGNAFAGSSAVVFVFGVIVLASLSTIYLYADLDHQWGTCTLERENLMTAQACFYIGGTLDPAMPRFTGSPPGDVISANADGTLSQGLPGDSIQRVPREAKPQSSR